MQEVYNKTMAMLFRGTKNLANNNAESNMGVLQEKNMQEVYNKTMAMLFRGTKNLANNNAESNMETDVQCRKDKLNYRQLSLSSTCGLVPGTRDKNISTCCVSCVRPECIVTSMICFDCRGGVGSLCTRQCQTCARVSCGLCRQVSQCRGCGSIQCISCAFLFDESSDSCICQNC